MNRFKERIKYYLVGFAIGLVLMYMIFGNRGCAWLPENRVKNMLAEKEIIIGDSLLEILNCSNVDNNDIYNLLNDAGEVNFSKSITNSYPKKYYLYGKKDKKEISVVYALYDSIVEVIDFNADTKTNCSSILTNRNKSTVPLPDAEVRTIIESNKIRIMQKAKCQIDCLKIDENEINNFHKKASIIIEKSEPRKHPNALYVLKGNLNNKLFEVTYVIGENRTRIANISPNNCNCQD